MLRYGRALALTLLLLSGFAATREAEATVVVTVSGNTAHADISLDGPGATTYEAEVTITFDSGVLNLTPDSINLTAELVDPNDPALIARLPGGLLGNPPVSVDPAFPMMITVEPPADLWIFRDGLDGGSDGTGNLSFLNTYDIEIHTHDLVYTDDSAYRLFKSPLGGDFTDYTEDVLPGSVRMRGRDGAFSQFIVVSDTRTSLLQLLPIAVDKLLTLQLRVIAAALDDALSLDLLGLLADVAADLVLIGLDLTGAIDALDQFIAEVTDHAGTDIPNVWTADHSVTNDAGEILGLAQSLRFTLVRMLTAPVL